MRALRKMWDDVLEELRIMIVTTEDRRLSDAELDRAALLIGEFVLLSPEREDAVVRFQRVLPAAGLNRIGDQLDERTN